MASSTTFDNKYIIYKNTPGLKGNINNNLTDSFRVSGIPLSATLTGSFKIDYFYKTMSWTGTLTLIPTDSCCTYLKCKAGDNSVQYFYAQNGKFNLGSSGQIGIAEFGFGMEKIRTYQWNDAISPVDLLLFENEGVSHPDGTGRIMFGSETDNGFSYSKTYYESFRIDSQWIGNYQPGKKWRIGDFGYKTNKDKDGIDSHVAPFFNFGKATLISQNIYTKKAPPEIYFNKTKNSTSVTIDGVEYNSNEYDILLYFTPSLNEDGWPICPKCGTTDPGEGIGAYCTYRTWFPGKPDGKSGNNWPQYYETCYKIGIGEFQDENGEIVRDDTNEKIFVYDKGQCYKFDWEQKTTTQMSWNEHKWIKITKITPDDFLNFNDGVVVGNIPSYYSTILDILQSYPENYMYYVEHYLNENRVLVSQSIFFASAFLTFRIKVKNVPSFKSDIREHTQTCGIYEGRLSGYASNDTNFYTSNDYMLWTDRRNMLNPEWMHSISPTVHLKAQTVYRNSCKLVSNIYFDFSDGVDNGMWMDSCAIKFEDDVFEDGFYCLFAFPKGVL